MNIKLSDLKVKMEIPTDDKFIEIFKKVLLKKLPCYSAKIKIDGIKPYSDYKPTLSTIHTHNMMSKIKAEEYPRIHVYQDGDVFIMSDDYNTYYTYLELGIKIIPCVVLGAEPTGGHVISKEIMEYPSNLTVEVLKEPKRN